MKKIITSSVFLFCIIFCFGQNPNFNYTQTCFGNQTIFVAISSLPDDSIQTWQWDMDGNASFEMSGKQIAFFFASSSTFAVKLKITTNSGSVDSITKNVIIDPLPNVNFHVDNLCEGKAAMYYNQSTIASGNISQFLWDFDNNGIVDDNSNDTVKYTCGPAQTYITKLTCISNKGCSAFATKTTQVYPQPSALFSFANTCLGDSTRFTNSSVITSPDYYLWIYGDAEQTASLIAPTHIYENSGTYEASLVAVSIFGCRDTTSLNVQIQDLPVINISANGSTLFYEGGNVVLTANGATSYIWNTLETTGSITVTQNGTYSVIGTDANGCKSNSNINIESLPLPQVVIVSSTILTPNGDGINDKLIIEDIEAFQSCIVKVYSIWNDEVFQSEKYKNGWEGQTIDGKQLPDGAYYYIISCDDKPVLRGNINILLK